jgi:uncharacterized protein (TIGR03083 family)
MIPIAPIPRLSATRCQTDPVDHGGFIEVIRREALVFAQVRPDDVAVPTCPEWTLLDLYHHLGGVHRWMVAQLDGGEPKSLHPAPALDAPTDPDGLVDWFADGADQLVGRLTDVGPELLVPTWFGPRPAVFWSRRAAHETAIHRWDAQAALASPDPLGTAQAIDGIDEILENVVPRRLAANPWPGDSAAVHLHATDAEGEWLLGLSGGELTVEHAHGKGDVAVRAPASDLLLVLAGRLPLARTETFGDTAVMDRWYATIHL